jgi:hypothetical protein
MEKGMHSDRIEATSKVLLAVSPFHNIPVKALLQ